MHFAVAAETAQVTDFFGTHERRRQAVRLFHIGVFEHDHGTDTVYWSAEQREIYGIGPDEPLAFTSEPGSSSTGFQTWDLIHPEDRSRVAAALRRAHTEEGLFDLEYRIVRRDGLERWVATRSQTFFTGDGLTRRPVRTIGATQDITDRRKIDAEQRQIERQANRAQRLESIGTLAGGIAHDLNNALTPILMMLDVLKEQYPAEGEALETVERSANHAAEMVRHLLSFAKGNEGRRLPLQPRLLIREMEKIIKGTFPKNIRIQMRGPMELPNIIGDATQLHQVLLNLCVNARDAMPNGGILTLEAAPADPADIANGEPNPGAGHEPNPGAGHEPNPGAGQRRYVVLRVTDTGSGIEPAMLERIFDPFFTTKGPEKGTGLGLFTAAGIVKGHEGFLRVASHPGRGAAFAVFLPVAAPPIAARPIAGGAGEIDTERELASTFCGNGELILYVDDENDVRTAAQTVLTRLNFTPLVAKDAIGGLLQAVRHRTELGAVITDLALPQMDGLAFVRALRQALPDVPVILASGRLEAAPAEELERLGIHVVLDKPFTQTMLANALRTAMGQKEPGESQPV
jgi:PAS domain S-box-containing protein